MPRFTEASKQAVLDRIDAAAVVADYVRLEKKNGRYWGLCPFHHEKTPSFTVDPDKKFYYCFGCHKGGSIVDFIMELDKLSYPETMEMLARRFGVTLAYETGEWTGNSEKESQKEALTELYRRVAVSFNHLLMEKLDGKTAKGYILNRGITIDSINRFRLGYAPADRAWLYAFLTGKGGFSGEFLASSGLFSQKFPQSAFFSNRLMFPIADRYGKTVAFGGRLLDGEGPKYINSSESEIFKKGQTLFAIDLALPELRRTKTAILAEGYMDVLALHQAGLTNAVAPLGTAFTGDQAKLLRRWVDKVILMLDSDEAGQNAAVKSIITARKAGLDCEVAVSPYKNTEAGAAVKDPADILQKFGPEALQNYAKSGILDMQYLLYRSRVFSKDKSRAVAFFFPYLEVLDSEVTRDTCIRMIADEFGVDPRAVREDFLRGEAKSAPRGQDGKQGEQTRPIRMNDELCLLTAVFINPELFRQLRARIPIEDIEDPHARELFITLEEWFRSRGGAGGFCVSEYQSLFEALEGELREWIIRQNASGVFSGEDQALPQKLLDDGIARLQGKALERKRKEIIRELRIPELNGMRQEALLAEKVYIDAELARLRT